ncbi:MAG: transporter substrate-binding domain-containing protein [Candidatus Gastranaerophilaceae bacterium]|jgi:putative glutamine transport system substrate-binding protein
MKKFKLVLLILISFILTTAVFTGCAKYQQKSLLDEVKKQEKIIVGVKFESKPFGFIDKDQKLKGFDIDLSKEIAKRILGDENAVEFKQVTSSTRILLLSSGAVNMIAATMTITPKRQEIIDFSVPYYVAGQAIMVPTNSNIKSVKDLNNKKVIVILGSTSEQNIRTLAPQAQLKGFRSYTEAFSALKAHRGDCLTTDDTIIYGFLLDNPDFKMLEGRYSKEPYGLGFKKSKETTTFQDAVNSAIEQMREDGTLKKIAKKWTGNVS